MDLVPHMDSISEYSNGEILKNTQENLIKIQKLKLLFERKKMKTVADLNYITNHPDVELNF